MLINSFLTGFMLIKKSLFMNFIIDRNLVTYQKSQKNVQCLVNQLINSLSLKMQELQDSIKEFISYDPSDIGNLSSFSSKPFLQGQANFFVLQSQMTFYSSMKVDYGNYLLTNYHPFFMMSMYEVKCSNCDFNLGYEVQTVNQNTIWMQGRFLIDVQKCSILKEGRDQMARLVKILKSRLSLKLASSQNVMIKEPQTDKERKVIERLQKISQKSNKQKSDKQKRANSKLKIRFDSLQTTNPTTNLIYKAQTLNMQASNFIESTIKNEQQMQGENDNLEGKSVCFFSVQSKIDEKIQQKDKLQMKIQENKLKESELAHIQISQDQREQIIKNMERIRQEVQKQSSYLQARSIIIRFFNALAKNTVQQKYLYKKIPSQSLLLKNLITLIRKGYLGDLEYKS